MSDVILVVDDDDWSRRHIVDHLEDLGFEIVCATDSAQAMDIFMSLRPIYLIIDINMPGHDGLWLAQTILNIDYKTIIFLMTESPLALLKANRKPMGVAAVMQKPLDFDRLKTMIKPYNKLD